eukprot:gene14172-20139_t
MTRVLALAFGGETVQSADTNPKPDFLETFQPERNGLQQLTLNKFYLEEGDIPPHRHLAQRGTGNTRSLGLRFFNSSPAKRTEGRYPWNISAASCPTDIDWQELGAVTPPQDQVFVTASGPPAYIHPSTENFGRSRLNVCVDYAKGRPFGDSTCSSLEGDLNHSIFLTGIWNHSETVNHSTLQRAPARPAKGATFTSITITTIPITTGPSPQPKAQHLPPPPASPSHRPSSVCNVVVTPTSSPPAPTLCGRLAVILNDDPLVTVWAPTVGLAPFACTLPNQVQPLPDGTLLVYFSSCAGVLGANTWLEGVRITPTSAAVATILGYPNRCTVGIDSSDPEDLPPYSWGRDCSPPPGSLEPSDVLCIGLALYLSTDPQILEWAPTTALSPFRCTSPISRFDLPSGQVLYTFTTCALGGPNQWLAGVRDNPVSEAVAIFLGYEDRCIDDSIIVIVSSNSRLPLQPYTWGEECLCQPCMNISAILGPDESIPPGTNCLGVPGLLNTGSLTELAPSTNLELFKCTIQRNSRPHPDGGVVISFVVCATGGRNNWLEGVKANPVSQAVAASLGLASTSCNISIVSSDTCDPLPFDLEPQLLYITPNTSVTVGTQLFIHGLNFDASCAVFINPYGYCTISAISPTLILVPAFSSPKEISSPIMCRFIANLLSSKELAPVDGLSSFTCTTTLTDSGTEEKPSAYFEVCALKVSPDAGWLEGVASNPAFIYNEIVTFMGYVSSTSCTVVLTASDTCLTDNQNVVMLSEGCTAEPISEPPTDMPMSDTPAAMPMTSPPPPPAYSTSYPPPTAPPPPPAPILPTTEVEPMCESCLTISVPIQGPLRPNNDLELTMGVCEGLAQLLSDPPPSASLPSTAGLGTFTCTTPPTKAILSDMSVALQMKVCAGGDILPANSWQAAFSTTSMATRIVDILRASCGVFVGTASDCGSSSLIRIPCPPNAPPQPPSPGTLDTSPPTTDPFYSPPTTAPQPSPLLDVVPGTCSACIEVNVGLAGDTRNPLMSNTALSQLQCTTLAEFLSSDPDMNAIASAAQLPLFSCTVDPKLQLGENGDFYSQMKVCSSSTTVALTWLMAAAQDAAIALVTQNLTYACGTTYLISSSCTSNTFYKEGPTCKVPAVDFPNTCYPGNSFPNGGSGDGTFIQHVPFRATEAALSGDGVLAVTLVPTTSVCIDYTPLGADYGDGLSCCDLPATSFEMVVNEACAKAIIGPSGFPFLDRFNASFSQVPSFFPPEYYTESETYSIIQVQIDMTRDSMPIELLFSISTDMPQCAELDILLPHGLLWYAVRNGDEEVGCCGNSVLPGLLVEGVPGSQDSLEP